jgi:hypothetical protein
VRPCGLRSRLRCRAHLLGWAGSCSGRGHWPGSLVLVGGGNAKQAQDFVAQAQAKNRAFLDNTRETLKASISDTKAKVEGGAATAQDKAQSWWDDMRSAIDARLASIRAERDEHRAERDLKKAQRRADDAEQDAADALAFAIAMLDQAEYAIVDALTARADADDLAKSQAG